MITRAQPADLPDIIALLRRANLLVDEADAAHAHWFVIRRNDRLQGVAGYADHAPYAVLRALVTVAQRQGHGRRLLHFVLGEIFRQRFAAAYAVTTTIPDWLRALGFVEISRAAVPDILLETGEFHTMREGERIFRMSRDVLARYA